MRRIAILAPYVGIINRGAETFVIELVSTLGKDYEIDVYTTAMCDEISNHIIMINIKKNTLFKVHKYFFDNITLYRKIINKFYFMIPDVLFQKKFSKVAFNLINKEKYDMLFPNNGVWGARYAEKYREKNKVPFIYTGHGGIGFGENLILKCNPNYYICLTKKHYAWCLQNVNLSTKTCIIPNGVHVNDFKFEDTICKEHNLVLSVGALTSFKRHELTIRAIARLNNVNLLILGEGEEYKQLKCLADELLGPRCKISSVPYADIKKYYFIADMFVLPSFEEPFGIVYLEAMAANLPIVAPNDSIRREIIGDAGLYCDVENIDEYAECIEECLNAESSNRPLLQASKYDWKIICNKYIEIINSVLLNNE